MERVSHNRNMAVTGCMISSPTKALGTWVLVYGEATGALAHCRVTDISAPKDKARHLRTRRVIELGYTEARTICGEKHMHDPPTRCPVRVFDYD